MSIEKNTDKGFITCVDLQISHWPRRTKNVPRHYVQKVLGRKSAETLRTEGFGTKKAPKHGVQKVLEMKKAQNIEYTRFWDQKMNAALHGSAPRKRKTSATLHGNAFL